MLTVVPDIVLGTENTVMQKIDKIYTLKKFTLCWEDRHINVCAIGKEIHIHIYTFRWWLVL